MFTEINKSVYNVILKISILFIELSSIVLFCFIIAILVAIGIIDRIYGIQNGFYVISIIGLLLSLPIGLYLVFLSKANDESQSYLTLITLLSIVVTTMLFVFLFFFQSYIEANENIEISRYSMSVVFICNLTNYFNFIKSIKIAEKQFKLERTSDFTTFLQIIYFFPVGIFFLHNRVKRILRISKIKSNLL